MTDQPDDALDADLDDLDDLDDLSYRDAVAELDAILAAIEDDAIDIDQLSLQVRRAATLIRLCQTRIAGARIEVERVVADLTLSLDDTLTDRGEETELTSDADPGDPQRPSDATDAEPPDGA